MARPRHFFTFRLYLRPVMALAHGGNPMKTRFYVIAALLFAVLFTSPVYAAPEKGPLSSSLDKIEEKLDTILKNQDEMKKELDEMKKELYVIKVRATQA